MKWYVNTSTFCGSEFAVMSNGGQSFSICFETFAFVVLPFTMLAAVSSYHIGYLRPPDIKQRVPGLFEMRKHYSLLTLIVAALTLFKDAILCHSQLSGAVVYFMHSVRLVSLSVHTVYLYRLCMIHFNYYRGPLSATLAWLSTFPSYVVALERICVALYKQLTESAFDMKNGAQDMCMLIDVFLYAIMFACQCLYGLTLVRKNSKYRTVSLISESNSVDNVSISTAENISTSEDQVCPVQKANWVSVLLFIWVQRLMSLGKQELLVSPSATYHLPSKLETKPLCEDFTNELKKVQLSTVNKKSKSLLKVLRAKFGTWFYLCGVLKFFGASATFVGPILLNYLVSYIETPGMEPLSNGFLYATGLLLATLVQSLFLTHFNFQIANLKVGVKSTVVAVIFDKTLTCKPSELASYGTGQVTNLMNTDVDRVVNFLPSFHEFWSLPLQLGATLFLLQRQVGLIFLASLGVALLMIAFNRFLAKKIGDYNQKMMKNKDDRVKLMTETLLGIRTVKSHAWEEVIGTKIKKMRAEEMKNLKGIKYFDAGCVFLWATTPVIISLITFLLYFYTGNEDFTAAKVFTVIALINILIFPLNSFPWVVNGLMEAVTSLKRLEEFVALTNYNLDTYYTAQPITDNPDDVCVLRDACFSWSAKEKEESESEEDNDFKLSNINFTVGRGHLVGVVGAVGSGKSSLLMAIAGELERTGGSIYVEEGSRDGVALVGQEAWLQHDTVRRNIVWGEKYDPVRYERVVEACALHHDMQTLPDGDATLVGENGVTLSGGQKARVSLARAVYQDKSIYLLDDPFSALDGHVADHVSRRCIGELLKDKTVILATHHTNFLQNADAVVTLKEGSLVADDEAWRSDTQQADSHDKPDEKKERTESATKDTGGGFEAKKVTQIREEDRALGSIDYRVYKTYQLAMGSLLFFAIPLSVAMMRGSKLVSDWWLSQWVNDSGASGGGNSSTLHSPPAMFALLSPTVPISETSYTFLLSNSSSSDDEMLGVGEKGSSLWYLSIYAFIVTANSVITLVRAFLYAYGGLCAAANMHERLLVSLLNTPVSYFDTTPLGRIINRFSSDMYTIDDDLPFQLNRFMSQFFRLLGTALITCYGVPLFTLVLAPLCICYYFLQKYYRHTSRELKRLSSISLSPIYAHFHETLLGVHTILAFRKLQSFRKHNMDLVGTNQRCTFSTAAAFSWLGIRLQLMGTLVVGGVSFIAVIQNYYWHIAAGLVGLALSYALTITQNLAGTITSFTETEKEMIAVERQAHYIYQIPQERLAPSKSARVGSDWPQRGAIEFRSVSLRYHSQLRPALDDLTFQIRAGERVGIVGRTGSGKSSVFTALLRIRELLKGSILIDGVSISKLPLHQLRSRITVVRQDPFLFGSSVRFNLDPAERWEDEQLWWALRCCGLDVYVGRTLGGLDAEIGERGGKLSVGQRQLLCLARGLLHKSKVLCLDESTANIDRECEGLVMEAVDKHFTDCTVLSIAHRMHTVRNCDRILTMENGRVKSFVPTTSQQAGPSSSSLVDGNSSS